MISDTDDHDHAFCSTSGQTDLDAVVLQTNAHTTQVLPHLRRFETPDIARICFRLRHCGRMRTSPYSPDIRSSMAGNAEDEYALVHTNSADRFHTSLFLDRETQRNVSTNILPSKHSSTKEKSWSARVESLRLSRPT